MSWKARDRRGCDPAAAPAGRPEPYHGAQRLARGRTYTILDELMRVHNTRYPMRLSMKASTIALWATLLVWAACLDGRVRGPAGRAASRRAPPGSAQAAAALQAPDAFETRVRPLLAANCYRVPQPNRPWAACASTRARRC